MNSFYTWVPYQGQVLRDVGIRADGTLQNPHGYPPEAVRAAVQAADQARIERRSAGAKKAAQTRRARKDRRAHQAAIDFLEKHATGPREHCYICGRELTDPESVERGIGSECWQDVLRLAEAITQAK